MKTHNLPLLQWLLRILSVAAILFIGSFSLDALQEGAGTGTQALNLLMHSLPALVLAAILAIAWRWEKAGGIAFLTLALALAPFVYLLNHSRNHFTVLQSLNVVLIINGPLLLVGALFLLSHRMRTAAGLR